MDPVLQAVHKWKFYYYHYLVFLLLRFSIGETVGETYL